MTAKEKENAPLQQATLNFSAIPPSKVKHNAAPKGTKRTLIVKADVEVNLDDMNIPATKEVVEAMRKRILELEDALEGQSSNKRARVSKTTEEEPKPSPSTSTCVTASKPKVDRKKLDAILKKFWSSIQKEVKTEKYKFRGGPPKIARIEEIIEPDEFSAIFIDKLPMGKVIQPTPDNKPNSSVTIIQYGYEDVEDLFGKHFKELKGNRYSLGGICARFAKGEKIGLVALSIKGLEVSYARNTMKCSMKIGVEEENPYRCGLDEDYPGNYGFAYATLGLLR